MSMLGHALAAVAFLTAALLAMPVQLMPGSWPSSARDSLPGAPSQSLAAPASDLVPEAPAVETAQRRPRGS